MIEIAVHRRPQGRRRDRRRLVFDATARYGNLRFELHGVHRPVVAPLRAVIGGTPGFTDCPWQLVRDGRVDLSGRSTRKMAGLRFVEGPSPTSAGEAA